LEEQEMANTKVRLNADVTSADGTTKTVELAQEMVKIGKHPSSHILVEDDGVARMHAYVETSDAGEVSIMDLGSATGTFVNGAKLTKKRALMSGDEIRLGATTIKVWLSGATGASAGTAAPRRAPEVRVAKPASTTPLPPAPPAPPATQAPRAPTPLAAPVAKNPFAPIGAPAAATVVAANPFATRTAPAARTPVAALPEEERVDGYYAIIASGPAVPTAEVETSARAIEVMVLWGERDILQVSHLSPPRPFVIGEGVLSPSDVERSVDFRMEADFIGADAMTIASPEGEGVAVNVPVGATITVRSGASDARSDAALRNGGELRASASLPGALSYVLREGETARVSFKGFVFQVKSVPAGYVPPVAFRPDLSIVGWIAGVSTFVLGLFLAGSFLLPDAGLLGGDQLDINNRYVAALIQRQETPPPPPQNSNDGESSGDPGQAARDASGEMGARDQAHADRRSAQAGDRPPEEWRMAQQSNDDAAQNNVVTNAVATLAAMFAAGPTSEYGEATAIGGDAASALGNLLGAQIGSSGGAGGLGMFGSGSGGGGTGAGTYGTGSAIGTLGRSGTGGPGDGYGHDGGGMGERGPVRPRVPVPSITNVQGGLTADQIRRVIQRNIAQVQHCYEQGLQRNPSLAGRVTVGFIISSTGAVGSASADNAIGDATVSGCVSSAVRRWAFPQPDPAGPVSVRFPFNLSQSGGQ